MIEERTIAVTGAGSRSVRTVDTMSLEASGTVSKSGNILCKNSRKFRMPEKNTKFTPPVTRKRPGRVDFTYEGPVFQTVSLGKTGK
jgi:hypothetical protein